MANSKKIKVNMVLNHTDETRLKEISKFIRKSKNFTLKRTQVLPCYEANVVNVFFNIDLAYLQDALEGLFECRDTNPTILDIDIDDHRSLTDLEVIAANMAHSITCNSSKTQHTIYKDTGLLAQVVGQPFSNKDFKEPKDYAKEPKVLWFGSKEDYLTILPIVTKGNISIDTSVEVLYNKKRIQADLRQSHICFFPKTFTEIQEYSRVEKIVRATKEGIFCIAPELDSEFCFSGTLNEGLEYYHQNQDTIDDIVKNYQDNIKSCGGDEGSAQAFTYAAKQALEIKMEEEEETFLNDYDDEEDYVYDSFEDEDDEDDFNTP